MRRLLRMLLGFKLVVVGVEWEGGKVEIEEELPVTMDSEGKPVKEPIKSITVKRREIIIDTPHYSTVYYDRKIINISFEKEWRLKQ